MKGISKWSEKSFFLNYVKRAYVFRNTHFQHKNTTPHTAEVTKKTFSSVNFLPKIWLQSHCGHLGHPTSRLWIFFFLFGYLKSRVYRVSPETLCPLKESTCNKMENIPFYVLRKTIVSVQEQVRLCLRDRSCHIQYLRWKFKYIWRLFCFSEHLE